MIKKEIFEKAHLNESSDLCRQYFKDKGLQLDNFYPPSEYYKLSELIQKEIYPLLADKTYSMIGKLRIHPKIEFDKDYVYLFADGYYFNKREAITFDLRNKSIWFCGWASGCNRIPFIKGFVKWCDYLKETNKTRRRR